MSATTTTTNSNNHESITNSNSCVVDNDMIPNNKLNYEDYMNDINYFVGNLSITKL